MLVSELQERQCVYNVTLLAWEKQQILHIGLCVHACAFVCACGYPGAWACVCEHVHGALLIQLATRMRHIVTSFVAPLSPLYLSTLSHKRYDFRKEVTENKMCVLIFSTTFISKISRSKKNLARYRQKKSKRLHVKYPLFL
jgi:hypothetical protein